MRLQRRRLMGLAAAMALAGCWFAPDTVPEGYGTCDVDTDCAPGKFCRQGQCYVPVWPTEDPLREGWQTRRAVVVQNNAGEPLPAGTPVPVVIGAGGVLPVEELGPDGVFMTYDTAAADGDDPRAGWAAAPVWRDIGQSQLTAWIPVPEDVPAGDVGLLSWILTDHVQGEITIVDDAAAVFPFYDGFDDVGFVDSTLYKNVGTGDLTVSDNKLTLQDNQQLVTINPLPQPFHLTAKGRIVGTNCDALFIGLTGDDFVGSPLPYAGLFFGQGLDAAVDVAPTETSNPAFLNPPQALDTPTAAHNYSFTIGDGKVRVTVDGELFDEGTELIPAFSDQGMYFTVDVDGNGCSFELLDLWVVYGPYNAPSVVVEDAVEYTEF